MPRLATSGFIPDLDDEQIAAENALMVQQGKAIWKDQPGGEITLIKSDPLEGWKKTFLNSLRQFGTVARACQDAHIATDKIHRYRAADPIFRRNMDAAKREFIERVEQVAFNRALAGSEQMLKFVLQGNKPEVYNRPSKVEASVQQNITSRGEVTYGHDQLSDILNILQQSGALPDQSGADGPAEEDVDATTD